MNKVMFLSHCDKCGSLHSRSLKGVDFSIVSLNQDQTVPVIIPNVVSTVML